MAEKPGFEQIEQRTAPNGARANLTYRPQTAQNWLNLGRAIGQASDILGQQQERINRLKMQNFEEQINTQYKEMNNALAQSQDPAQFDAIVGGAVEKMKATGKDYLGDRLFNQWERDFGANYYAALKADTDGQKIRLNQKLAFNTAQDTVKQKAYAYGYAPESEHAALDRDFALYLENNEFPPLQKQALKEQYGKEKVNSRLSYLLDAAPAKIAYTDKTGKVVSPMDDEKQYTELTVAEKVRWKNAALNIEKARRPGSGTDKGADELLYQRAIMLLDKDPQSLQDELKAAGNNLYAFQQKFKQDSGMTVSAKDLKNYLEWAQKTLDDPDGNFGRQKLENYAQSQTEYKAFEISDEDENYKVYNKDLNNASAMAAAADKLRIQILDGRFTAADAKKAQGNLENLRRALGSKIKNNPEKSWFGTTADEWLQNQIHAFSTAPGAEDFPLEDVAGLYETAVKLAGLKGVELSADYNENAAALNEVMDEARTDYVSVKYGVPARTVEAALVNGRVLALQENDNPTASDYARAMESYINGYKAQNGLAVKKAGNNILSMYYDED